VGEDEVVIESLPLQAKLEVAFVQHGVGFGIAAGDVLAVHGDGGEGLPGANVPDHHGAGAIVVGGYVAFEVEVRNRVIFDLHGETLIGRVKGRTFRDSPGLQNSVEFQA